MRTEQWDNEKHGKATKAQKTGDFWPASGLPARGGQPVFRSADGLMNEAVSCLAGMDLHPIKQQL